MAFVKPYAYADGTVLTDDNQALNEEAAKVYVNQEIVVADAASTFAFDEIETGELQAITNDHKFCSSAIYGQHMDSESQNRAYYTSTTKANSQTSATSIVYRDLFGTGKQIVVDQACTVIISFQGAFSAEINSSTSGGDGSGQWENKVLLKHIDYTQTNPAPQYRDVSTACYVFENAGPASGVIAPGSTSTHTADRRQIMFQLRIVLAKGRHDFNVSVNPKVEKGFTSARNITVEVFYL